MINPTDTNINEWVTNIIVNYKIMSFIVTGLIAIIVKKTKTKLDDKAWAWIKSMFKGLFGRKIGKV